MDDKMRFLGEESRLDGEKRVSIIPAPMAKTLSWGQGADMGPGAILAASPALETFDDELLIETVGVGIETLAALSLADCPVEEGCMRVCRAVSRELERNRLPVVLGGEHSVSLGAIAACLKKYPDLHVVQVDAHLDLRDRYEENQLSHACVMRRLDDMQVPFTQIGARSFSREEHELVCSRGWMPWTMRRIRRQSDWVRQVCGDDRFPVYLTFDVDVLDPGLMPATGTPEPDGLSWEMATALLRGLARQKKIIGLDFVEFSPKPGLEFAAFTIAKLIYRTLGYIYHPLFACED